MGGSFAHRFLGFIGNAISSILDLVLVVVLCVLVVSETALPIQNGIDPRSLWKPTDLERTLIWNQKKIVPDSPTLTSHAVLAASFASPLQPQSSNIHQWIVIDLRDDSYPFIQDAANIRHASAVHQAGPPVTTPEGQSILEPAVDTPKNSPLPASTIISQIACEFPDCERTFEHRHEYHRHKKSHTHPEKCTHCGVGFETSKDVNRHINSVHATTQRIFCTFQRCKYSRSAARSQGFPRKDNWRRHMKNRHAFSKDMILRVEAVAQVN